MDKSIIIEKLREREAELKAAGILRLSVFGSVARGDATAQSDVDLMGDFDRAKNLTVFDMAGLEVRLADILGTPVDLADRRMLKAPVRAKAERKPFLPFKSPSTSLRDIWDAIGLIVEFTLGMDLEAFQQDAKTVVSQACSHTFYLLNHW